MNSDNRSPTSKRPESNGPQSNRPLVVLFVDDLSHTLTQMRRLLGLAGFVVLTAGTIEQALRLLRFSAVDAIVADLRLGGPGAADGGNLLDACRRWHPGVVRILATADPIGATIAREGGHLYYDKDSALDELVLMIRMWVPRA
jgi:DNA-binding NtrC family response regulator